MKEKLDLIYHQHDVVCNQKYNEYPYSLHLKAVVKQVEYYLPYVKSKMNTLDERRQFSAEFSWKVDLILAAAGHDLIEDARMTYNDLVKHLGRFVADLIYACTENKGRNRLERHDDMYFDILSDERWAVFIKLCDIKANVLYSVLMNSSMYNKYQKEFPRLYVKLHKQDEFELIWDDLRELLKM